MRYLIFLAVILWSAFAQPLYAESVNAGFVQGIWYSEEPVFVGNPTRIYVALRNNTEHDLTGTVRFSIDGTRIGSSDVRALSGRLVEVWVDWTPTYGEHTVVASVSDAKLHIIGGGTESIDITGMTSEDILFVDRDIDKDGVGNEEDTDDDGDGVSDEDEKARGTNPQNPDPKPTDQSADEADEVNENETTSSPLPSTENASDEEGLERFLADGRADTVVSAVTDTIVETKQSLDSYREARAEKLKEKVAEVEQPSENTEENATITRSRVEPKQGLFERFVSLFAALLSTTWSFVLFITSFVLGFPALIEIILLWLLLLIIYRTARRYGRRNR